MKILFVHLGREHLGIEYLSALLRREGHETSLAVDIGLFGQNDNIFYAPKLERLFSMSGSILEKFKRFNPDVVFFSAYSTTFKWCIRIAEEMKKARDVPTLLGGIHPTLAPEYALSGTPMDYAFRGEAESVIVRLAERLGSGASPDDIPGVIYRDKGEVRFNPPAPLVENLDSLPFPDKQLFAHSINIRDDYMTLTSRGCPFQCAYCCEHIMKGMYDAGKYLRLRSVDNLMDELGRMKSEYKYTEVFFCSPVFPGDREWVAEFSRRYRREIGVPFWCFAHTEFVDAEYARLLREAGCWMIEFGVQTLNESLRRDVIRRKETNERIARAFRDCDAAGLPYDVDNIFYLPGEQESDYELAVRFYAGFKHLHRVKIFNLTLFPGTAMTETALERGLIDAAGLEAIKQGETGDYFHMAALSSPVPGWKIRAYGNLLRLLPLLPGKSVLKMLNPVGLRCASLIPIPAIRLLKLFYLAQLRDPRFILYAKLYARHFIKFILRKRTA